MSPGVLMRCSVVRAALQEQEVHVLWLVRHIKAGQHPVHQGARASVRPMPMSLGSSIWILACQLGTNL